MSETLAAERWFFAVFSGDVVLNGLVGGRISAYRGPIKGEFPQIVYGLQTPALDIVTVPLVRVGSRLLYQVKVIGRGNDFGALEPIVNRVDLLIQAKSGTNVSGVVAACYRDQPISYLESSPEGVDYAHVGGLYRLVVQGA